MTNKLFILLLASAFLGCQNTQQEPTAEHPSDVLKINQQNNLLNLLGSGQTDGFQWMNEPSAVQFAEGAVKVTVAAKTDFFNNPENGEVSASAPFLYREADGDFVATALVKPDFADMWNACALMVHLDSMHWIKFAFENSDATGKSIVSVVTRSVSDDANGVVLNDAEAVWLRIIRKGNNFAMHWSLDGKEFKMTRLAQMPESNLVKIGLEAQCPAGKGATHDWLFFSLEEKTVEDMRKGI